MKTVINNVPKVLKNKEDYELCRGYVGWNNST